MKISVEFPSVAYREGPDKVAELARAIEAIGYDDLAVFDHVVMGYETPTGRPRDIRPRCRFSKRWSPSGSSPPSPSG